jgi:DHA2 family multidrug resistance protein
MSSTTSPPPDTSADSGRLMSVTGGDRYPWIAMGVVLIGTLMVIMDTTIVNVALPRIGQELHHTRSVEWVATAYLLAVGISTPASAWLADVFGRRTVFISSLGLFAASSLACALAPGLTVLVVLRAVQGAAGGALVVVGMAMIYELFPPHRRGTALGVWGVAAMAGPALGPVLGGLISTNVSWRWLFLINVPVGAGGVVAGLRLLRDAGFRSRRPFDGLGLLLIAGGALALLLGFSESSTWGWSSPGIVGLLVAGPVLFALFVLHVLRVDHPVIDVRMFGSGTFSLSLMIICLFTMLQYGRLVFIPIELQTLRGFTPLRVGVLLVATAAGAAITMPIGGRLADRIGARTPVLVGAGFLAVSAYMLANFTLGTSQLVIVVTLFLNGIGTGLAMMPNTVAGMNSLHGRFVAQASSARSMAREIAGSMGIAIFTAIVSAQIGGVAVASPDRATALDAQHAYDVVFLCGFIALLVAIVAALFLPGRAATAATHAQRAREAVVAAPEL